MPGAAWWSEGHPEALVQLLMCGSELMHLSETLGLPLHKLWAVSGHYVGGQFGLVVQIQQGPAVLPLHSPACEEGVAAPSTPSHCQLLYGDYIVKRARHQGHVVLWGSTGNAGVHVDNSVSAFKHAPQADR